MQQEEQRPETILTFKEGDAVHIAGTSTAWQTTWRRQTSERTRTAQRGPDTRKQGGGMVGCTKCPWTGQVYELQTYPLFTSTVQGCPICGGTVRTIERAVPRRQTKLFVETEQAAEAIAHRMWQHGPPDAAGSPSAGWPFRGRWKVTRDPRTGDLVEVPDDAPS
jgi:hypothetical protein